MVLVTFNTSRFYGKSMNVLSSMSTKKVQSCLCSFPINSKILYGITCRAITSNFTQTGQYEYMYRKYGSHIVNSQETHSHLLNFCSNLLYQIVYK